ncbi:hypothetical protein JCM5350_004153 [Sporobolomyces pararoseus]
MSKASGKTPVKKFVESRTGSIKREITWMFSKQEVEYLRTCDPGHEHGLTKTFDNDTWSLTLYLNEGNLALENSCTIAIDPVLQDEDFQRATSRFSWVRKGSYNCTVALVLPKKWERHQNFSATSTAHKFDPSNATFESTFKFSRKDLLEAWTDSNSLGIRCSLSSSHQVLPSTSSAVLLDLFDNDMSADTVFALRRNSTEASDDEICYLFALERVLVGASAFFQTLFQSDTVSEKVLDLQSLPHEVADLSNDLVDSELAPFYQVPTAEREGEQAEQDQSSSLSPPQLDENDPEEASGAGDAEPQNSQESDERPAKKIKIESSVDPEPVTPSGRLYRVLDVCGEDFRTYEAMLGYWHCPVVRFLPLASDYLVEYDKRAGTDPDFEDARLWPSNWFEKESGPSPFPNARSPCSVYEMYRLGDRLELKELQDYSLDYIRRSLTTENVAYELFTPLSLDFERVRNAILKWFVKNWATVKKTKGFQTVLSKFSSGELSKGKDLMAQIFEML